MRTIAHTRSRRSRSALLGASAITLLLLAGCSEDAEDPPETTEESTSTTEAPTATSTTEATSTTKPTKPLLEKDPDAAPEDESDVDPWARTAMPHREDIGDEIDVECPEDGEARAIWGSNLYTDDSSICTAAVHVGLITIEEGGDVTILIEEGQAEYIGSDANDVESRPYGSWPGSFSFPEADPLEVDEGIAWSRPANFYGTSEADVIEVTCAADGEAGRVWGTDTYTDDSSICTAALHSGLITLEEGGPVAFSFADGLEAYEGSTANSVTSSDYGSWGRSFEFVDD